MVYTPIPKGTLDWDAPVNAAFLDQDSRLNDLNTATVNLADNVSGLQSEVDVLQRGEVRLVPDVRNDYVYNQTPVTITNNISPTPTIPSAQRWAPPAVPLSGSEKRGPFYFVGATDFVVNPGNTAYVQPTSRYPHTYANPQASWGMEFYFYGQQFEVRYQYVNAGTMFRVTIDDRKVTDLMQAPPGTTPGLGSGNCLKVDFRNGDTGAPPQFHKIKIDVSTMPFGGIYTGPNDSLGFVQPYNTRIMGFGDSLTGGSNMNTGFGNGTWLKRFGRLVSINDVWNQSIGSTGYLAQGPNFPASTAPLPARVASDIIPYNPDIVLMWAGYNDASTDPTVLAQIQDAEDSCIQQMRAAIPGVTIIVVGPWFPSGALPLPQSLLSTSDAIKATAQGNNLPFIEPYTGNVYNESGTQIASFGPWITGSGNTGTPGAAGNANVYIGTDNIHPNDAGHQWVANLMAASFAAIYSRS